MKQAVEEHEENCNHKNSSDGPMFQGLHSKVQKIDFLREEVSFSALQVIIAARFI